MVTIAFVERQSENMFLNSRDLHVMIPSLSQRDDVISIFQINLISIDVFHQICWSNVATKALTRINYYILVSFPTCVSQKDIIDLDLSNLLIKFREKISRVKMGTHTNITSNSLTNYTTDNQTIQRLQVKKYHFNVVRENSLRIARKSILR